MNSLSRADQKAIWVPKLGFTNALGPFQVITSHIYHISCDNSSRPLLVSEVILLLKKLIKVATNISGNTVPN